VDSGTRLSLRLLVFVLTALLCSSLQAAAPEKWIKLSMPPFTILTAADEASARKWVVELQEFRRGLQDLIPVSEQDLRPVTVVLFKTDEAMDAYRPLENGNPKRVAGLFVRANDINTIMLSVGRYASETRHLIFHEAVHWHLSAVDASLPLWFSEGLAELYSTFELTDASHYAFGTPIVEHDRLLNRIKPLPLAQLVTVRSDSLLYNEGARASVFYAESWAFLHMLSYGQPVSPTNVIGSYMDLLKSGQAPQQAFTNVFGADYAELDKKLKKYLHARFVKKRLYPRVIQTNAPAVLTDATVGEIELAKGSLLAGSRTPAEAEPHLRWASELAPNDPRPWELLGHLAVLRKDFVSAREALARAAANGSTSYLVYHNLAVCRLPESAMPGRVIKDLNPKVMDAAAADFRRAIELAPSYKESYDGLAGLVYGMATFTPDDFSILQRGLKLAPEDATIQVGLAACELRQGKQAEGLERLNRTLSETNSADAGKLELGRKILQEQTLKAAFDEVNALLVKNRFREALAAADRALTNPLDTEYRQQLLTLRVHVVEGQEISDAVDLANHGQRGRARQQLERLAADSSDASTKAEAHRLLKVIGGTR
jgi:tetratricopeptide (TPR) repeat protein